MTDIITVTGLVATQPRHLITAEGVPITSFRLASNQRRYDRKLGRWVDAGTNWYTISTFRSLAINAVSSLRKGERVVVQGRLRISDWESGERRGTNIEVDADALGHDLSWGTAVFTRSVQSTLVETAPEELAHEGAAEDDSTPPSDSAGDMGAVASSDADSVDEAGFAAAEPLSATVPF